MTGVQMKVKKYVLNIKKNMKILFIFIPLIKELVMQEILD